MLDLKSLKVVLAVAELGNMTAAGRRLGLTQSAVSQAVRQLEESLGAVLIARERRPLALTAAGVALRERGAALMAEAETLFRSVREQAGNQAQLLRLGMVDSFAATVGPPLVQHLLASAVQIHVASGLAPGLGASLLERRLDVIVTTDPPPPAASTIALDRHPVLSERYVLLLPKALAKGRSHVAPPLSELSARLPMVRFNRDSHIGAQVDEYLRAAGLAPPNRLQIDTADSLVAMVAGGLGWSLITPLCLLQARADPRTVAALSLPDGGLAREFSLVARRGEYGGLPQSMARHAAEIFRTRLQPQLARLAPWLVEAVSVG